MAGQNTLILATDFNAIQTKIARVLGPTVNDGDYGYGQTVTSSQVDTTKTITVTQWEQLRADILKTRNHQTGGSESLTAPTTSTKVSESVRSAYMTMATACETNRLTCAANRGSEEDLIPYVERSTAWNGDISHYVNVTFASYDAARYFFNAGGEIRFAMTLSGGNSGTVNSKDWTWSQMFSDMNTIKFGAYQVTTSDASSTSIITPNAGFHYMNTTTRIVYNKAAPGSSTYSVNDYFLWARFTNSNKNELEFRIQLADTATSNPPFGIDENVTGLIRSYIKCFRPSGSGQVSLSAPPTSTTSWA